ncbi:hypothetical protein RJ639_037277 [Escallonia herrerae]|uniref:Cation/H+ exchanger transmembrane domain-containing protein n=1 Tax=Escallonia herrerae TaxID=1293975 RepID=A0AA88WTK3_9ASTE|nr:hypothetical protein RJ639_037277 [Escallonia herrerae]
MNATTTSWFSDFAANLESGHRQVVPITVFVAVLCLCMIVGHLLEENRWVNESLTAIFIVKTFSFSVLISLSITLALVPKGALLELSFYLGRSLHILRFDEELFFIYLLPPIIFNAGFQVKKKQFFHNFLTIMLIGVIGVFISSSIITVGSWWLFPKFGFDSLTPRDYLAIGTIFSSTDTVCTLQVLHQDETPLLYSLVFGEGVVNDATSVVLFNAVQKIDINKLGGWSAVHVFVDFLYLFSTSTALGFTAGLLTAYVLRGLYFGRHSTLREIALMVLMAYLSYMLAEFFNVSGILTVFFAGVLMSHYAWYNVTESSRITTRHVFATVFYCRNVYFSVRGNGCFGHREVENEQVKILDFNGYMQLSTLPDTTWTCCFCVSTFCTLQLHEPKCGEINFNYIKTPVICWAGLMRGAVYIALAFKQFRSGVTLDPVNATMVTTTIIVVLFSMIVFGFLTKPLVNYLLPHQTNNSSIHREPRSPKEDLTLPLLSFEESASTNILRAKDSLSMLIERPVYTIHSY